VAECGDAGEPIVRKYPDSPVGKAYTALAATVMSELVKRPSEGALPEVQL
jgi:ATP-binding protein involved in chromosome partitioning